MKHLKFKIISINPLHLLSTSPNNNSKMALSLSNYTSDFFAKPIEFNLMKNDHLIHHPEIISSIDNIAEESPKIATFYASTFVFKNSLLEFKKIKTNLKPYKRVLKQERRDCLYCKTQNTPLWRKGPDGHKSLCNACGLKYYRIVQKEQKLLPTCTPNPISKILN